MNNPRSAESFWAVAALLLVFVCVMGGMLLALFYLSPWLSGRPWNEPQGSFLGAMMVLLGSGLGFWLGAMLARPLLRRFTRAESRARWIADTAASRHGWIVGLLLGNIGDRPEGR